MRDQPTLLRQWTLLRTLGARRQGVTLRDMAAEHEVSQKTIQRDLELLRRIGFPVEHVTSDHGRRHWKLNGNTGLTQLGFTLEEAAALYLGRQFLEPLAGTDFFQGAQSAFAKIRATLGEAPLRHLEKLAAAFYHKTHGLADYSAKGRLLDDLVRAIEDRRLTVITYQSLRSTEPVTLYDVHPYAVVWHKHALYLIGWSAGHAHLRQTCGIPIALDESAYTLQDVHAIIAAQAADVLVLDPHEAGGLIQARKAAALCEAAGLPVTLHSGGELGISVAAYLHFAVYVPNLTLAIDMQYPNMASDIVAERHPFSAGWMTSPLGPGLGVAPDPDRLAALRTSEIPNPYLDPSRPDWFTTKPAY